MFICYMILFNVFDISNYLAQVFNLTIFSEHSITKISSFSFEFYFIWVYTFSLLFYFSKPIFRKFITFRDFSQHILKEKKYVLIYFDHLAIHLFAMNRNLMENVCNFCMNTCRWKWVTKCNFEAKKVILKDKHREHYFDFLKMMFYFSLANSKHVLKHVFPDMIYSFN